MRRNPNRPPPHAAEMSPVKMLTLGLGCIGAVQVMIAWVVPPIAMLTLVPLMQPLFRDLEAPLPRLTRLLFRTAGWLLGRNPGQTFPGVLLAAPVYVIMLIGMLLAIRHAGSARLALIIVLLVPALAWGAAIVVGLLVPFIGLIEHLSEPGAV